jgi:hypothetical protein
MAAKAKGRATDGKVAMRYWGNSCHAHAPTVRMAAKAEGRVIDGGVAMRFWETVAMPVRQGVKAGAQGHETRTQVTHRKCAAMTFEALLGFPIKEIPATED